MHVHAGRRALLALAARRAEKGFSALVADVIERRSQLAACTSSPGVFEGRGGSQQRRDLVLSLAGSIGPEDAEELRQSVAALRESWR
jgi:hypothetical protein